MEDFHVVNLHFTDKCNYKCVYCFSKKYKGLRELSKEEWFRIIDNIKVYYDENEIRKGRVNLVGGEPLMNKDLMEMINYVNSIGLVPSILTNGSLLTKELIDSIKGKVRMIGISIDSMDDECNIKNGRNANGKVLDKNHLYEMCRLIKDSGIVLKINTVVSKLNMNEDFSELYNIVKPDRIKIMQVYINEGVNESSMNLVPTSKEFDTFVNRHLKFSPVVEDNDTMDSAYLMVDAQGNVISNHENSYRAVGNALTEDFKELVKLCNIDSEKFALRFR